MTINKFNSLKKNDTLVLERIENPSPAWDLDGRMDAYVGRIFAKENLFLGVTYAIIIHGWLFDLRCFKKVQENINEYNKRCLM